MSSRAHLQYRLDILGHLFGLTHGYGEVGMEETDCVDSCAGHTANLWDQTFISLNGMQIYL